MEFIPHLDNIEKLVGYVSTLDNKSPYKKTLVKYEQRLIEKHKQVRALALICNNDDHNNQIINTFENIDNDNWLVISNLSNINDIPENYFTIVLWSDCDIQSEFRQILTLYSKLRTGSRIYFDNLIPQFAQLLNNCLSKESIKTLIGGSLTANYIKSMAFAQLVKSILDNILQTLLETTPFSAQLFVSEKNNDRCIALVRGLVKFEPNKQLSDKLVSIDKGVAEMFPMTTRSNEQLATIFNRIFSIVASAIDKNEEITPEQVCERLAEDSDDCEKVVTDTHIDNIIAAINTLKEHIYDFVADLDLADTEMSPCDIAQVFIDKNIDLMDETLADKDQWAKYIRRWIYGKLREAIKALKADGVDVNDNLRALLKKNVGVGTGYTEYPEISETAIEKIPAPLIVGLSNVQNSCFMDSVLFSIFLNPFGYFHENILEKKLTIQKSCNKFIDSKKRLNYVKVLQNELRKLSIHLRTQRDTALTCLPIRKLLSECNCTTEALMAGNQQDDSEFLLQLMDIFDLTPTRIRIVKSYSDNGVNWNDRAALVENSSTLDVKFERDTKDINLLQYFQQIIIEDLPKEDWFRDDDQTPPHYYRYSKESRMIISSQALIFRINRQVFNPTTQTTSKNKNPIAFPEYIENTNVNSPARPSGDSTNERDSRSSRYFELQIVTIHHGTAAGGHFTSYVKYEGVWLYYNDMGQRVTLVKWEDVVNDAKLSGTMFIYAAF